MIHSLRALGVALLLALYAVPAFGQAVIIQGGPATSGHFPIYSGSSSIQPVVIDSGSAAGGGIGANISSLGITARGTGTAPYASQGLGQFSTNFCMYDAPITNATGYHYLCFDPNAQGGGLIAYGAGGTATPLSLNFIINGVTIPVTSGLGDVVGPSSATDNTVVLFNGVTGKILKDASNLYSVSSAIGVNTATPGSQAAASGYPCFNTGAGHGCLDVGGVITLHAQQTAIYIYGLFGSTAYFAQTGLASWGYASGLVDNHTFALLYTTDSFALAGSTVQRAVWNPNYSYLTNYTSAAVNPSFNSGLAIGWNFSSTGGETNFINNTMSLGTKDFVFSDWSGSVKLDLMTLSKDVAGGAALIGASYPNPANIGQLNVNSGANNNVLVAGSSVSNTVMATYYNSPVMFYQLTNNTVNNIFCEDFRSANVAKNSFAAMCAQITDVTNTMVSGTLTFLTASASSVAARALTISASGGVWAGSTLVDPGASSIGGIDVYSSNATYLMRTKTTLTSSAAAQTATMTNAPTAGNPTKWFAIDDNGTSRKIPAW